jgi:hypothetical protein
MIRGTKKPATEVCVQLRRQLGVARATAVMLPHDMLAEVRGTGRKIRTFYGPDVIAYGRDVNNYIGIGIVRFENCLEIFRFFPRKPKRSSFIQFFNGNEVFSHDLAQYGRVDRIHRVNDAVRLDIAVLNSLPLQIEDLTQLYDPMYQGCTVAHIRGWAPGVDAFGQVNEAAVISPEQIIALCAVTRTHLAVLPAVQYGVS